jgi:hypothetical protein
VHFGIPDWAVGVGFIIIAVSLGKALIRAIFPGERWAGRRGSRRDMTRALTDLPDRPSEIDEIQERLGQIDDLQRRLAEVEERLDFAERLLTKQSDADRLASPQH